MHCTSLGPPSHGTPYRPAGIRPYATILCWDEEKALLKWGTGSKAMARTPFASPGPLAHCPGSNASCSPSALSCPRAAFVHGGAFSGLPGSCDECLLVACIHPPSEALARLLIKPPSGCTVLSGSSTPCLLLLVNELAAKAC